MRDKISLVFVEYPDNKVAVQCVSGGSEAEDLFNDCNKTTNGVKVRMTLVKLEFQEGKTSAVAITKFIK